ncbi:amidohydrolase [Staphylococcus canis]|uniref:Amidohydrolase n=1 Tax=Staphylococcus canis TaxID=2724942 RepID=A0ABS0TAV6_9STAP|nr:amidohydrolase [Staphylococcus canis]MBI5975843.1 amidohydrolase [Staphylococcus canis]
MRELTDQLITWRRQFHQQPEISHEEYKTTEKIRNILEEHDITILDLPLKTGLIAEIGQGDTLIGVRSDIDALPIIEDTTLAYKSENEGAMHACGHDIHMASILGVALLLKAEESQLNGRVRIIFQAAEEVGDGAIAFADSGALDDAKAIIGYHNDPTLKVGEWRAKTGHMTSNVDRFVIKIEGVGAHAAMPQDCKDPSIVVAQLINSLQTVVSRNLAPYQEGVVTIGRISSGETWNVIPKEAELEGTIRSLDAEVRDKIEQRLRAICEGIAQQYEVKVDLEYKRLAKSVVNDEQLQNIAYEVAESVGYQVDVLPRALSIGEDFSGYQKVAPTHFAMIGSDSPYALHHPKYQPDEAILEKVPHYFVAFVKRLLEDA